MLTEISINGVQLYQPVLTLTHWRRPNAVMPTEVGIHDFAALNKRKAWVPTCVGMTGNDGRYVIHFTGWYQPSTRYKTTSR